MGFDTFCDRIDELDPEIHAFLPEPDRRARLRAAGVERPTFLVAVKDIFRVDGFETRAGSALPAREFEGEEAACVTRLLDAGALVLGKTHTTEFAMLDPGPTRNPRNLAHTPGGSSSGSVAAIAAGMATLAIGSQTTGSVIRPAAYCGVVGFKPSFDRIPTAGMLHCSPSVDHVGLFTADVAAMESAAAVLLDGWRGEVRPGGKPVLGVPESARASRGQSVYSLLEGADRRDRIVSMIPVDDLTVAGRYLVFLSRLGVMKRTPASEFSNPRLGGVRAAGVKQGDGIMDVVLSDGTAEVMLLSRAGRAIRFPEEQISVVGRMQL